MLFEYLKRGIIAGLSAGLLYGLYMVFVGNPFTQYVHDAGHSHSHDHSHDHGHAVSETTGFVVSAGSGVMWAIFLGSLFAIALYVFEPALPGPTNVKSNVLAGAGFFSVSVTPWLVLPPAAPGAEQLYTIETRLAVYGALIVLGAVVSLVAVLAFERATSRSRGFVLGAIPVLAVVVVLPAVAPTVVVQPDLDSTVVSVYHALVVFSQAGVWLLIAASFNALRRYGGQLEGESATDELLASP